MNLLQVIMQLQQQFKIEPCFTQLVWQKLEEQNQEFFRAYYTRLKLKDQIILFNHLLDEQVKMFQRMPRGSHMLPGAALSPPTERTDREWRTGARQRSGPSMQQLGEYLREVLRPEPSGPLLQVSGTSCAEREMASHADDASPQH